MRAVVVSFVADKPFSPRGQRTRHVIEEMERRGWVVELLGTSAVRDVITDDGGRSLPPWVKRVGRSILIDKYEPQALRQLWRWRPQKADLALLLGFPWSPLPRAAARFRAAGTPYVVDVGDPWVLTAATRRTNVATLRAARAERRMWESAAGAIVTTRQQGQALKGLFPSLATVTRPNGYDPPGDDNLPAPEPRQPGVLRVVHYGQLHEARIDPMPLLAQVLREGPWDRVRLSQHGPDWKGLLRRLPDGVDSEVRPYLPWTEVRRQAPAHDVAMVIGHRHPDLMASKAISYLTLPIPRLAVVGRREGDALAEYAERMPGFCVVEANEAAAASRLAAHLSHHWTSEELAPPPSEAWPTVAATIVDSLLDLVGRSGTS